MSLNLFVYICNKLQPVLSQRNTLLPPSASTEKREAAALTMPWGQGAGQGLILWQLLPGCLPGP